MVWVKPNPTIIKATADDIIAVSSGCPRLLLVFCIAKAISFQ